MQLNTRLQQPNLNTSNIVLTSEAHKANMSTLVTIVLQSKKTECPPVACYWHWFSQKLVISGYNADAWILSKVQMKDRHMQLTKGFWRTNLRDTHVHY